APDYGHLPLLLAPTGSALAGSPLSKREGVAGLSELRDRGFMPAAIGNYLLRIGHGGAPDGWLEPVEMSRHFRLDTVSRSAAHFDEAQLLRWQREAVRHAAPDTLLAWLGERLAPLGD